MLLSFWNFAPREVDVLCTGCGTDLPEGSQFCLNCGRRTISSASALPPPPVPALVTPEPMGARRQRRIVPWLVLGLVLLGAVLWAGIREIPGAQSLQEFAHWAHTQTVVDSAFSVNPHSFSSYEFTVPEGALSISVSGEFSAAPAGPRKGASTKGGAKDSDTDIEAYVLTDAAFAVWKSGYSTETQYESGPVGTATINTPLPDGARAYDLVFSNRNSTRAKTVHATVLLRYKSWLPDAVLRIKDRFWNWIGL